MGNRSNDLYEFGGFRFDSERQLLSKDSEFVALSPKAAELLSLLLSKRGDYVSKDEIFESIWPDTFVEDGVLTQNIYVLRKILGGESGNGSIIENRTRLGYRITTPIEMVEGSSPDSRPANGTSNLTEPKPPVHASRSRVAILALTVLIGAFIGTGAYFFITRVLTRSSSPTFQSIQLKKVTDTGNVTFSTLSPDGDFVAFARSREGVFIKDLRTSVETKLIINKVERYGHMQFSRDGEQLYLRNRASPQLPSQILKVSRYGGEPLMIAENVWSAFQLSPDEKQVAFVRNYPNEGRSALIVKRIGDGEEKELLSLNSPDSFNARTYPAWSPDGKKILCTIKEAKDPSHKIRVIDPQTSEKSDLALKDFQNIEQVAWLPQRNTIAVAARTGKNFQLWEVAYPGAESQRITNDLNNYPSFEIGGRGTTILLKNTIQFANLWVLDAEDKDAQKQLTFGTTNLHGSSGIDVSPSDEIVYASSEGDSAEIDLWRLSPKTGERRQLTQNSGNQNENPDVSPDGQSIYFNSNRGGLDHIWRVDIDGGNPTQITFGQETTEIFPQISPNGDTMYFVRKEGALSCVWQRSLTTGAEQRLTKAGAYAPASFLALSPDGKYLAFHNLTKIDSEDIKQTFQIVAISTAAPEEARFYSIGGGKVAILWTKDSSAFDFVNMLSGGDEIRRVSLDEKIPHRILRRFPREALFTIARLETSDSFVVSRGARENDPVLLTNFR